MRFIIHEQPYEKVIAAGELRYERNGQPTGGVERWRLTTAVDNYQFLRIDLDARVAPSGQSTLYHLVLNENGRPERLRFRHWQADYKISGNLLFEAGVITASRDVNGEPLAEEIVVRDNFGFWLPSTVGLSSLARSSATVAVSLRPMASKQYPAFTLFKTDIQLSWDKNEKIKVIGQKRNCRPFVIQWADHLITLWLDEQNAVLKMMNEDGLTAVATRLIYYK